MSPIKITAPAMSATVAKPSPTIQPAQQDGTDGQLSHSVIGRLVQAAPKVEAAAENAGAACW